MLIEKNGNLFEMSGQRSNCETLLKLWTTFIYITHGCMMVENVGLHRTTSMRPYVWCINKVDLIQPYKSGDVTRDFVTNE